MKSMEKAKMMTETAGTKKDIETIGGIDVVLVRDQCVRHVGYAIPGPYILRYI